MRTAIGGAAAWAVPRCGRAVASTAQSLPPIADPHLMVLRVAADVRAIVAILSDGTRQDLRMWGDVNRLGARAAVLIYPRELDLHRLLLLDHRGQELPDTV